MINGIILSKIILIKQESNILNKCIEEIICKVKRKKEMAKQMDKILNRKLLLKE